MENEDYLSSLWLQEYSTLSWKDFDDFAGVPSLGRKGKYRKGKTSKIKISKMKIIQMLIDRNAESESILKYKSSSV